MITAQEVLDLIDSLIPSPWEMEEIPLDQALHRILREPILAPEDHPPFHRSSIDGYLTHPGQHPGKVSLLRPIRPGEPAPALPSIGTVVRIHTGSSLPPEGALLMQEDARILSDQEIELLQKPTPSLMRLRGSHFRKGDMVLPSPHRLEPGALALLASIGKNQIKVSCLPRVAHLVTGDELTDPSLSPQPGTVRDSNSILIHSLLRVHQAPCVWHGRVGDDRRSLMESLMIALNSQPDLILISGGSSVGDHDHTGNVLQEMGFRILVRQVAIRPGKPLILAQKGKVLAFGLPGNPLSHFVCFHLFIRRALDRWVGHPPRSLEQAELVPGAALKPDPRETWWPCHQASRHGTFTATPLAWQDSSDLSCLAQTNALLRIPAGQRAGSPVDLLSTLP